MQTLYRHYFVLCHNGHGTPIPRPSQVGTDGSLQAIATGAKKVILACSECGLVSEYSGQAVHEALAARLDIFEAGEGRLVRVAVECDGENCEALKDIHTVQGVATGTWRPKVVPRNWKFSDSARCSADHKLRLGDQSPEMHPERNLF